MVEKGLVPRLKVLIFGTVGGILLKLLYGSIEWVRNDYSDLKKFPIKAQFILAFWHSRQLLMGGAYCASNNPMPVNVLISEHTDGRIIARAIQRFNIRSVGGSSTRGGTKALRMLLTALRRGESVAITPDGPKGPVHVVKEGIIRLSQMSQIPIYPVSLSSTRKWCFKKSWDQMILPKPFSRGVCLIGEPVRVPAELDKDEVQNYIRELERKLNELTKQADEYVHA